VKTLLQVATLVALAINVASTLMLYWTTQSPGQDAAGRGMANGFLIMTVAAMIAAAALLLASYWTTSWWPALLALVIAIVPLIPVVLPALL
jgi:peptidoglycan biosynthesis protein MviN/MurJ (putative lipid II flippase)